MILIRIEDEQEITRLIMMLAIMVVAENAVDMARVSSKLYELCMYIHLYVDVVVVYTMYIFTLLRTQHVCMFK
jgi:hypothetical protein